MNPNAAPALYPRTQFYDEGAVIIGAPNTASKSTMTRL